MMHYPRFAPVGTEECHSTHNPFAAEDSGKRFFIPEPILQGKDDGILLQEWCNELRVKVIGKGFQAHKHKVRRSDLFTASETCHWKEMKIPIYGMDMEPGLLDGCQVTPQQKADIMSPFV
jgi:hypothetical protein